MDDKKRTLAKTAVHTVLGAALLATTAISSVAAAPVEAIYFVNPLPQFPAWRLIGDCMAQEADRLGVTLTETGPTDGTLNMNVMMQQVQQGISNNVDAIVTFPASDGFVPLLEQADTAGILVGTLYGSGFTASASDTNVGANFATVGQIMVETLVEREGQKKMVIGSKGEKLKIIGRDARQDLEKLLDEKVYLELWVKVKSGWADDERALRSLGYGED
jgi:ABC-type sugar transport system substrate-binding protein